MFIILMTPSKLYTLRVSKQTCTAHEIVGLTQACPNDVSVNFWIMLAYMSVIALVPRPSVQHTLLVEVLLGVREQD